MLTRKPKATKTPDLSGIDSAPETQLYGTVRSLWKPATLNTALSQADSGSLEMVSDLSRALLADDRIRAALNQRINGLEGAPVQFELDDPEADEPRRLTRSDLDDERVEVLQAVERDWYGMMTTGQRKQMKTRGMLVGICPVYVREWYQLNGRLVPRCEPWSPRWLRYVASEREWYIQTQENYIRLSDQPLRWFLYCPFGDPYDEPWISGFWYALATWWLLKSYAIQDMGQFSQSHASPKWFMETLPGASIIDSVKREALKWLERIAQRAAIYIPQGFKVTSQESSSSGAHQIYPQEIEMASRFLAQAILGTDSTVEKEASYASASAGARIRQDLLEDDGEAESDFWHHGPLKPYTLINFGAASDVPWPVRNVAPPEDTKALAETQSTAAQAWATMVDSGGAKLIDGRAFLQTYFPVSADTDEEQAAPTILNGAQIRAAVDIMIQLAAGAIDSTAASTMLEAFLGIAPETAAQIVGGAGSLPAGADVAMAELHAHGMALLAERTGKTHFPKKGDDRKVSLRTSEYDTFDPDYVDSLKEDWPEIWEMGGSTGATNSGDSQYKKLRPVIERGGSPETDTEEEAIRVREAWAARHYENNRIKGVVALAKWFVVGKIGEQAMKAVIEERKALVRKRREKTTLNETFDAENGIMTGKGRALLVDYKRDEKGRFASKGLHATTRDADGKRVMANGAPLPPHIQALALPPAWEDVHVNPDPAADLQAVGFDAKGRSQYVYSQAHSDRQAQAKFERIRELQEKFPAIVEQNRKGFDSDDVKVKDTSECLHVVMHTGIRPGSTVETGAEKQAYGATTLQKRHVKVDADGNVRLQFVGKKGVDIDIPVTDKTSAAILRARAKKAGGDNDDLFPNATQASLGARSHEMDGGGFKSKDFRTHHGTAIAQEKVSKMDAPKTEAQYKKQVKSVAQDVSGALGNTPTVALQSYIDPTVFQPWRAGLEEAK